MRRTPPIDLEDLDTFGEIVRAGGISAAARQLGAPKATIGRRLVRLENAVGGPLFDRVGRRLKLTALGEALWPASQSTRTTRAAASSAVASLGEEPRGHVRIGSPVLFAQRILAPILGRLLRDHPRLDAEIVLDQRPQDPLHHALDLAIRVGSPTETGSLISRRIATLPTGVFVAGRIAERVRTPTDLNAFDRIVLAPPTGGTWTLQKGRRQVRVDSPARATVNDPAVALAVLDSLGRGVTLLPRFLVAQEIATGRMRQVLGDWKTPSVMIYALMPPGRGDVPAVRAALDAMVHGLQREESWRTR